MLATALALATSACPPVDGPVALGFVYEQRATTVLVESSSLFRLAVAHVNEDGGLGCGVNLTYVAVDGEGEAFTLLNVGIQLLLHRDELRLIGLVGTAHGRALRPLAMLSSTQELPILSPGSSGSSLYDKSDMPYLLRATASDASQASFCHRSAHTTSVHQPPAVLPGLTPYICCVHVSAHAATHMLLHMLHNSTLTAVCAHVCVACRCPTLYKRCGPSVGSTWGCSRRPT
jgi:hypothetical protein